MNLFNGQQNDMSSLVPIAPIQNSPMIDTISGNNNQTFDQMNGQQNDFSSLLMRIEQTEFFSFKNEAKIDILYEIMKPTKSSGPRMSKTQRQRQKRILENQEEILHILKENKKTSEEIMKMLYIISEKMK